MENFFQKHEKPKLPQGRRHLGSEQVELCNLNKT